MTKLITVNLPDDVETHDGFVKVATFREPVARDYFALGEPMQAVRGADGEMFFVEKDAVIEAYLARLVQAPLDPVSLGSMSMANAMACREEIIGFFGKARGQMYLARAPSSSST